MALLEKILADESTTHDSSPEGRGQLHAQREPRHRHLPRRAIRRGRKGTQYVSLSMYYLQIPDLYGRLLNCYLNKKF